VLFGQALDQLRAERVVRPGLDRLMRAVSSARVAGRKEIRRRLDPDLTPERCGELDELLVTDPELGVARLVWLNAGATSASSDAAKTEVAKLAYLEARGADRLDLSAIAPERLRQLATVARRSTPRALRQMDPERRHPILLAALAAAHTEIVDETVRVFDMMLSATDANARDEVAKRHSRLSKRHSRLSKRIWSVLSCWTTSSTSSSTPTSRTPRSAAPCGHLAPSGSRTRSAARRSAHRVTAGTWS